MLRGEAKQAPAVTGKLHGKESPERVSDEFTEFGEQIASLREARVAS